jgi:two-component system cell cycle response regulator
LAREGDVENTSVESSAFASRDSGDDLVQKYVIALCGLTPRNQRLLEMLLALPAASRCQFHAADSTLANNPSIAIVDSASSLSVSTFDHMRQRYREIVPVFIVDDESSRAESRYAIVRASLMRNVSKVLGELVEAELSNRGHASNWASESESTKGRAQASADAMQPVADAAFVDGSGAIPEPLRAIVVDDSRAVREQLLAALDRLGLRCEQACDAAQAQSLLAASAYDLALLDVVMPGMDGYELCREIKRDPYKRKMPVVMLTSRSSPFDRARGALSGCDSYLTKPITWDEFRKAIDKVLLKSTSNDRSKLTARGYAVAT